MLTAIITIDRLSVQIDHQSPKSKKSESCLPIHSKTRKVFSRRVVLPPGNLSKPGLYIITFLKAGISAKIYGIPHFVYLKTVIYINLYNTYLYFVARILYRRCLLLLPFHILPLFEECKISNQDAKKLQ